MMNSEIKFAVTLGLTITGIALVKVGEYTDITVVAIIGLVVFALTLIYALREYWRGVDQVE